MKTIDNLISEGYLEECKWSTYGLSTYKILEGKYKGWEIAYAETDEEADNACFEYISESVWAFSAEFLEDYTPKGVDADVIKILQSRYEGSNCALIRLIGENYDAFLQDAVSADGRGHFLSLYDGKERDSDEVGLPSGGYVYRI